MRPFWHILKWTATIFLIDAWDMSHEWHFEKMKGRKCQKQRQIINAIIVRLTNHAGEKVFFLFVRRPQRDFLFYLLHIITWQWFILFVPFFLSFDDWFPSIKYPELCFYKLLISIIAEKKESPTYFFFTLIILKKKERNPHAWWYS